MSQDDPNQPDTPVDQSNESEDGQPHTASQSPFPNDAYPRASSESNAALMPVGDPTQANHPKPASSNADSIFAQGRTKAFVLYSSGSLTVMAGAAMAPTIHPIKAAFADAPDVDFWARMVLALPALGIVIAAPIAGRVIDKLGRRPVLLASLLAYGAFGCSGFVASELWHVLLGRLLFGFGVAGVMSAATTLVGDYYRGGARARFMGYQSAFMALGGILSPKIAGELADVDWHWPFLVYSVAFAIFAAALFAINEPKRARSSDAQARSDSSDEDESSRRDAWRIAFVTCGAVFIGMLTFYSIPLYLGDLLIGMGYPEASQLGTAIMFLSTGGAVVSLNYGRIRRRMSFCSISAMLYGMLALGFFLLWIGEDLSLIAPGLLLIGVSGGLQMPNLTSWLLSRAPGSIRGTLSGAFTFALFLGQFLSMFAFQALYARGYASGENMAESSLAGAKQVYIVCAAVVAVLTAAFPLSSIAKRFRSSHP